jgi:hypothetical protein
MNTAQGCSRDMLNKPATGTPHNLNINLRLPLAGLASRSDVILALPPAPAGTTPAVPLATPGIAVSPAGAVPAGLVPPPLLPVLGPAPDATASAAAVCCCCCWGATALLGTAAARAVLLLALLTAAAFGLGDLADGIGAALGLPLGVQKPVMPVPMVATLTSLDNTPVGD